MTIKPKGAPPPFSIKGVRRAPQPLPSAKTPCTPGEGNATDKPPC